MKALKAKNKRLHQIYKDVRYPPAFTSPHALHRYETKISKTFIKQWLKANETHTRFKHKQKTYNRPTILVGGVDYQWCADLIDMSSLARYNDNTNFLLTVIDVFTKYAWVEPLKSKTMLEIVRGFTNIFARTSRLPHSIQTDRGKEFLNIKVDKLFSEKHIKHFTSNDQKIKSSVIERFNRTLESRLFKAMYSKNSNRYLELLPHVVGGYNNTYHSAIGKAPSTITPSDTEAVWKRLYGLKRHKAFENYVKAQNRFSVKTPVRISIEKNVFEKRTPNWSKEIFRIKKILPATSTDGVVLQLADIKGNDLHGYFNIGEVQPIVISHPFQKVEKILKKYKNNWFFVKWYNYPNENNSWIQLKDLSKL